MQPPRRISGVQNGKGDRNWTRYQDSVLPSQTQNSNNAQEFKTNIVKMLKLNQISYITPTM